MTATNDYSEFKTEEPIKVEAFAELNRLVAAAKKVELELLMLGNQLKTKMEAHRDIVARRLPELMKSLGLAEFKTNEGLKIEIKEDVQAAISEAHRAAAHKWLEGHGHGGLIKRDIVVSFNKGQEEVAAKLMKELEKTYAAVTQNQKVHPSTLKAWAKEMLKDGKDVPADIFGIFRQNIAKFSEVAKSK